MRYFICLSYNGSAFSGWQVQENANSVQAELQKALSTLLKEPVQVVGAGRTDTGVNARNYIAHFDFQGEMPAQPHTVYKLNAILPKQISVHSVYPVPDEIHARFSALSRTYKYYIHTEKDPFCSEFSYFVPARKLNFEKMNLACQYFLGEQDFSSLEKVNGGNKTSICNVTHAGWEPIVPNTDGAATQGQPAAGNTPTHYVFTVTANRFLRNMVRAMVGSLLEVGSGKREPEWIKEMLAQKNRCAAGHSVPGNALFLVDVEYPVETKMHSSEQ
jgi:tRNA pseudouridine38-40 synthase